MTPTRENLEILLMLGRIVAGPLLLMLFVWAYHAAGDRRRVEDRREVASKGRRR